MSEIREVTRPADIAVVARLADEIWNEHYVPIIGQAQVDYMIGKFQSEAAIAEQIRGGYLYFLISDGGEDAGYLGLLPDERALRMLLSKIYVRKDRRGEGLGRAMMALAEDLCRRMRLECLWLTVNKNNRDSIAAYERMGFANVGPVVQDIGGGFVMDDFRMEKRISREKA